VYNQLPIALLAWRLPLQQGCTSGVSPGALPRCWSCAVKPGLTTRPAAVTQAFLPGLDNTPGYEKYLV